MSEQLFTLPRVIVFDTNAALVSGAKANFYIAGTLTRQNTFTDSALTVAHANPVVADGNGVLAPIYLDATLNYKVDITDSLDSSVGDYPVDNITAALTATEVGTALYPATTAETSAGVTIVDLQYPPGDIRRYQTNTTPGTTNMQTGMQDAYDSGADTVIYQSETYLISTDVTATADVVVKGNGAIITGDGSLKFQGTSSDNVTAVATQAEIGDQTVVLNAAGGIVANDLIRFRDTVDNSFSPYNTTDRGGEMHRVSSISGANVTLVGRLEAQYPVTTTQVDIISPIKIGGGNFRKETNITTTDQPISLDRVADSKLSGVQAYGGELRAWEIESCFNVRVENCEGVCTAAAVGFQYGLSFSQSQGVVVDGGYFYGTRHGSTMGTSGKMPTRHCFVKNAELSNSGTNSGAADFHSACADSAYIDCRIHNVAKLSGRNCKYVRCHITAKRNDAAMGYLNPNGGVLGYYNCTVNLANGHNFAQIISDISATTSRNQNVETRLEFLDNDIEVNSNVTRIANHVTAQIGNVDISFYHRGTTLSGDLSGLLRYLYYTLDTGNPGSFSPAPVASREFEVRDISVDLDPASFPSFELSSGNITGSRFHIDILAGTWTPTYVTDGTDFDSVTYDAITNGDYRRIGDLVFVEGIIRTDAITVGSGTGSVQVGGLPYTVANASEQGALTIGSATSFTANKGPIDLQPRPATTKAYIRLRADANDDSAAIVAADMATGTNVNYLRFSGWYITSDNS